MQKRATRLGLILGLFCLFATNGPAAEPEPYRWGQTLEEMNQILSQSGESELVLKEDIYRNKAILPYQPLKSIEIPTGMVTTIFLLKKGESSVALGQFFGYLYEGKLLCRAQLFKHSPLFSIQEILSQLKKQYPEGKTYRALGGKTPLSYFEYQSAERYVFTNEQGVYICDPEALNRVVREARKGNQMREAKELEEQRESLKGP